MHIFITGGTRGIGKGLALEFLKKGNKVSFTGTSIQSIENAKKDLNGKFNAYVCDVRNYNDILKSANQAIEMFGNIDIWINNAGVDQERLNVYELSESEVKRVIDINVLGTINGTSIAVNQMIKQGYGRIYNLEGLGSNGMVIPKTIIYGSSKRLISYFSNGCNKELKEFKNISVGTIQPGMVLTDLLMNNMNEEGMKIAKILGNDVDYVSKRIVKGILQNKKKIKILTNLIVMWRFISSPFRRK